MNSTKKHASDSAKSTLLESVNIRKKSRAGAYHYGSATVKTTRGRLTNIRWCKRAMTRRLQEVAAEMNSGQVMLIEYKPFQPTFYHTDLAEWGIAYLVAKAVSPKAKLMVDTGRHYQAQNVEQIVACLVDEEMLRGFHFNHRRYADAKMIFSVCLVYC